MTDQTEVLAEISASTPRRWIAIICLFGLGGVLLYVAFAQPPAFGWQMFLLVLGGGALWMGDALRRATEGRLELTETELREAGGEVIAYVADVKSVDRGFFAFKPSNGFLMRTTAPAGAKRWRPGLWWRLGNQIGIGGVAPGSQTKFASEILSAMIAQRDMPDFDT